MHCDKLTFVSFVMTGFEAQVNLYSQAKNSGDPGHAS